MIDLITPQSIIANLRAGSKKQALQELAKKAAELTGQHERAVFDVLLERGRLGTTGVGHGIAIPHGKLSNLEHVYGVFARLERPVDFDAIDDQPVDLLFVLVVPPDETSAHLQTLAALAKVFMVPAHRARLREQPTGAALYEEFVALMRAEAA